MEQPHPALLLNRVCEVSETTAKNGSNFYYASPDKASYCIIVIRSYSNYTAAFLGIFAVIWVIMLCIMTYVILRDGIAQKYLGSSSLS